MKESAVKKVRLNKQGKQKRRTFKFKEMQNYFTTYPQASTQEAFFLFSSNALEKNGISEKKCVNSYSYGFQGQEHDNEIKGEGNSVNYKYRMHDPRVGRFFAVDPLAREYPFYTPYAFSGNDVIGSIEIEGLEPGKLFNTEYGAAQDFSRLFNDNSIRKNREYACRIYVINEAGVKKYSYTNPVMGGEGSVTVKDIHRVPTPSGAKTTAYAHTHAASTVNAPISYRDNEFSGTKGSASDGGDIGVAEYYGVNIYVATPNGSFQKYNVATNKVTLFPNTGIAKDTGPANGGNGVAKKSTSVYEVVSGDTLSQIAEKYHTSVKALAKENNITDVNKIDVGQKLNVTN